jgi:hypothetical protein
LILISKFLTCKAVLCRFKSALFEDRKDILLRCRRVSFLFFFGLGQLPVGH